MNNEIIIIIIMIYNSCPLLIHDQSEEGLVNALKCCYGNFRPSRRGNSRDIHTTSRERSSKTQTNIHSIQSLL